MMPATMTSAGSAVEFERDRQTLDHVGAVTGYRGLRDRRHGALAGAGVVFGDDDDEARYGEADQAADEQVRAGDDLSVDGPDRLQPVT